MKKDIVAALIFLATGLVFLVAQMEGNSQLELSPKPDCVVSETVLPPTTPQR